MQSLRIRDLKTGEVRPIAATRVVFGRDDACDIAASGPKAGLASSQHAELTYSAGAGWMLADLGSTNGTFLNGKRLTAPQRVKDGDVIALALNGPTYSMILPAPAKTILDRGSDPDATLLIGDEGHAPTMLDHAGLAAESQAAASPPSDQRFLVVLRRTGGGGEVRAAGRVVVLGRDPDCDMSLRTDEDKIISSRHAEIRFDDAGQALLVDLDSRNGTWLGRRQVDKPTAIRPGDSLTLGRGGPEFAVVQLGAVRAELAVPDAKPSVAAAPPPTPAAPAAAAARPLRPSLAAMMEEARRAVAAKGGGTTMLAMVLAHELGARSSRRLRWIIGISAVLVVMVSATAYILATRSVREAAHAAAEAREALAAQVEEAARLRERSEAEIRRLTRQLGEAQSTPVSRRTRDSLVRRVDSLRTRSAELATNLAVVRGLDLGSVVRNNLPFLAAVGQGLRVASAFFLTADGYLLTSSAIGSGGDSAQSSDTVFVYPGGRAARPLVARVVAREGAVAVLKVGGYGGDQPTSVNWSDGALRVGRAIAALGFVRAAATDSSPPGWVSVRTAAAVLAADSVGATAQSVGPVPALGAPVFDGSGALVGVVTDVQGGDAHTVRVAPLHRVRAVLPADVRRRLSGGR